MAVCRGLKVERCGTIRRFSVCDGAVPRPPTSCVVRGLARANREKSINTVYIRVLSCVALEIGTAGPVSLIEIQYPLGNQPSSQSISNLGNWPFFSLAACGGGGEIHTASHRTVSGADAVAITFLLADTRTLPAEDDRTPILG